ncbi:PfkB family carbohydrate kinase [Pelagibacteraceae bacterium]|nr:PfkB family carbohydrate kinase [Pelagibacteraceae bacterium]
MSESRPLRLIKEKYKGKKIGLCHGVYDIFHHGHLLHIKNAKLLCDILVLSLTEDKYVNKGPGRPFHNEDQRAEILRSIKEVDYVHISRSKTAVEVITELRPNYYIKGPDYKNLHKDQTGRILLEKKAIKAVGGQIKFTDDAVKSSTQIYNSYFAKRSDQELSVLKELKSKFKLDDIEKILDKITDSKILVVGEPIIDHYIYSEARGLSNKSYTVSVGKQDEEKLLGGSLAIAKDLNSLGCKVKILTANLIDANLKKEIETKLSKKIKWNNIKINDADIPIKSRFVTSNHQQKLFEVSNIKNINFWTKSLITKFKNKIEELSKDVDIIIVADYGHGLFNAKVIEKIMSLKKYIAINTQTNSNNFGFNYFNKYKKFNYLSVDEKEFRLALGKRYGTITNLIKEALKNNHIKTPFSITAGVDGSYHVNKRKKIFHSPIFFRDVKDTTGAGDAFYGISTLLTKNKVDSDLLLFISNCYAGLKCQYLANKETTSIVDLKRCINSIFM